MNQTVWTVFAMCVGILFFVSLACLTTMRAADTKNEPEARQLAKQILGATGVKGGLVVHVGCGDGSLTSALRAADSYLVHGLDADQQNVRKARQTIESLGSYGPVSVDRFDGEHLPYIANLANLCGGRSE